MGGTGAAHGWRPHVVTDEAVAEAAPVAAFQALLDDGLPLLRAGDPLPPLWHWLALPIWPRSSALGADGHPRRGGFLPPIELPRRMFAGGEIILHAPIPIGSSVRRGAEVIGVEHKQGRSGALAVVTTRTRLHVGDTLCLEERQDLIYRSAPPRDPDVPPAQPAPPMPVEPVVPAAPLEKVAEHDGGGEWVLRTDPTLLMRFSAATANPHRIHYDWPYATGVEGYPGLVVQGPLMTLLLAEAARLSGLADVRSLTHRNVAPLFCGDPGRLYLAADPDAPGTHLAHLVSAETVRTSLSIATGS
ncbi:MaoC family dehydratase N-terminal domain-containing protein [Flexivirga oryzae]|uniref:3-methylfumaryl-CoA hydratase n=1 Tax=Flexivirga oryzae TaxID=1794944 RepID=A0A839N748_9MICO|nr:MaoC family dehydratase N-terminal domain-containing protein [Flexivirga oryzae]MBB2893580.1 3-methylfumaryl-CoA hydratase [Flexivirga oryzae]